MFFLRMNENKEILCVGLLCFDILNYVEQYPKEDTLIWIEKQVWSLGGNACNNCTVIGQLPQVRARLFCSIAKDYTHEIAVSKLQEANVDYSLSLERENCKLPISTAIISQETGSRTIMHCPSSMPEPTLEEFAALPLSTFHWIHFEGRNMAEVRKMMDHLLQLPKRPKFSVEIEKKKPGIDALIPGPDVVFLSKDFAKSRGYGSMRSAVEGIAAHNRTASIICAWGELGATGQTPSGDVVESRAFPPERLVDTLGAGDTFVAGTLHSLIRGHDLASALEAGCRLSGRKCGQRGLLNILS